MLSIACDAAMGAGAEGAHQGHPAARAGSIAHAQSEELLRRCGFARQCSSPWVLWRMPCSLAC